MHFQFAQYLDLARSSRHERNRTSLSTVILTYRRCIGLFAHGAHQHCHRSRVQDNTISACMECTRHTVLFRKYRWAAEHPSFYALTSLFPSISRYKRSHTRVDKQDGNSNNGTIFLPTPSHFHSVKMTYFLGSSSSHNDCSYKDLRTFTASLLVHLGPLSGSSPWW